jgi:hypothetical protein
MAVITPTAQEKRRLNGLAKAQQLVTDFLAVLERDHDWEPSRVFLLGFSQVFRPRSVSPTTSSLMSCACCLFVLVHTHRAP